MKIPRREYTAEFKMQAVKRVNSSQGIAATARELGVVEHRHCATGRKPPRQASSTLLAAKW